MVTLTTARPAPRRRQPYSALPSLLTLLVLLATLIAACSLDTAPAKPTTGDTLLVNSATTHANTYAYDLQSLDGATRRVHWSQPSAEIDAPILSDANAIYAAQLRPGQASARLTALRRSDGATLWIYSSSELIDPIAVRNGVVYAELQPAHSLADDTIVALDAATGRQRWTATMPGTTATQQQAVLTPDALLIEVAIPHLPPESWQVMVVALRLDTGQTLRITPITSLFYTFVADGATVFGAATTLPASALSSTQGYDVTLSASDSGSGHTQWSHTLTNAGVVSYDSQMIAADGVVCLEHRQQDGSDSVTALREADGATLWSVTSSNLITRLMVSQNRLIVDRYATPQGQSTPETLTTYALPNGAVAWSLTLQDASAFYALASGHAIYLVTRPTLPNHYTTYMESLNASGGALNWKVALTYDIYSLAWAVANG